MPAVCKSCGCSDIDTDPARGDAVCTKCGSVVDDHLIVSEVEFEENSAGGANVIGQYVAAEGNYLLQLYTFARLRNILCILKREALNTYKIQLCMHIKALYGFNTRQRHMQPLKIWG